MSGQTKAGLGLGWRRAKKNWAPDPVTVEMNSRGHGFCIIVIMLAF